MGRANKSAVAAGLLSLLVAGCAGSSGDEAAADSAAGDCKFATLSSDQFSALPKLEQDPNAMPDRVLLSVPPHEPVAPLPLTFAPDGAWADNAHIAVSPTAIVFEVDGRPADIGTETLYRDGAGRLWREYGPGRKPQRRNAHSHEFLSLTPGTHLLKVRHRTEPLEVEGVDFRPAVLTQDMAFEIDVAPGRNYYLTHLYYRLEAGGRLTPASRLYLAEVVEGAGSDGGTERMFLVVGSPQGDAGMTLDHRYRLANLREKSPDLPVAEAHALETLYRQSDWLRAESLRAGCG